MTDVAISQPSAAAVNLKSKESREAWVAKLSTDSLAAVLPRHLLKLRVPFGRAALSNIAQ